VIFDERPQNFGVKQTRISFNSLNAFLAAGNFSEGTIESRHKLGVDNPAPAGPKALYQVLAALIWAGKDAPNTLLASLRKQGITRLKLDAALRDLKNYDTRRAITNAPHSPTNNSGFCEQAKPNTDILSHKITHELRDLLEAVQLEIDAPRDHMIAVLAKATAQPGMLDKVIRFEISRIIPLRHGTTTPFLYIDGTGDPLLAQICFGELADHHFPVERNAIITQVVGKSFSKRSITGVSKGGVEAIGKIADECAGLRSNLCAVLDSHPQAALFGSKSVIAALRQSTNPMAGHFGNLRGQNHWQDAPEVIVVGREQPGVEDVERIGRAYAASAGDDFSTGPFQYQYRGVRLRSGHAHAILVPDLADPWADRVLRQIREAEIEQAIDRIRLIHNEKPKEVFILSEVVVNATVDRVVKWQEFKVGGSRIERAVDEFGMLLLSGNECAALMPTLWQNARTANRDLKAAGLSGHKPSKKIIYGICPDKVQVLCRYSRPVASPQRQRKYTALVFSSPNQARAKLETVTGSLAHFEILNEDT
jgi:hypothetical protein